MSILSDFLIPNNYPGYARNALARHAERQAKLTEKNARIVPYNFAPQTTTPRRGDRRRTA